MIFLFSQNTNLLGYNTKNTKFVIVSRYTAFVIYTFFFFAFFIFIFYFYFYPFRLFGSQNNNRGGYNVGSLYYYEGSILSIEWTNQHSCGDQNSHCEQILQYMCGDQVRDGATTK